jgi:hypothetical protein
VVLVEQGKAEGACPKFAEVVRLDPESVDAMLRLADCYERTGRVASAWSAYQAAAEAAGKLGQAERVAFAREPVAALAGSVPRLLIQVAPGARAAGLLVKRDGVVVDLDELWAVGDLLPETEPEVSAALAAPERGSHWMHTPPCPPEFELEMANVRMRFVPAGQFRMAIWLEP